MAHRPIQFGPRAGDSVDRLLLAGVTLPLVYFGIQLAAAPFFPGYSFLTRDASTLGSDGSTAPWIFNGGALLVGTLELVTAGAFLRALPRARIGLVLTWTTALALASASIGSLNAFLHPLPDPKHSEGLLSLLGSGMVMLPLLLTTVLWRIGARGYALFNILLCLALIPILTGLVQRIGMRAGVDLAGYQTLLNSTHGLLQRVAALLIFGSISVVAHRLRRPAARIHRVGSRPGSAAA
jgi:hypothetical protein